MDKTAELAREFERESYRIDQMIWDAMALRAGETALFCGCSNNVDWIKRAVAIGVQVSVVGADAGVVNVLAGTAVTIVRGSTSMIPANDDSYDAAVAFHYLHEVDPFFHANVVSELSRVGKRLVIVEPAPPGDALGLRIAALYSRAKRELGQFEAYHPIDYWRKLLSIVKSDVTYETLTFMRTPPRYAIQETAALIIAMMAAQETPESYLAELRALAKRPDAQLLPQARNVIVGSAAGALRNTTAGTNYRDNVPQPTIASPFAAAAAARATLYSAADAKPEFPAVAPAKSAKRPAGTPQPGRTQQPAESNVARNAFGLPLREEPTRRPDVVPSIKSEEPDAAFGLTGEATDAATEFGWEWESPKATP